MNRRGFLSMLGAAFAAPLIPKGTAFSFLGGIYRPAWTEIPATWPLAGLHLTKQGQSITIRGPRGVSLAPGWWSADREIVLMRADSAVGGASAFVEGIRPNMNDPRLLVNRNGDYLIEDAKPGDPEAVKPDYSGKAGANWDFPSITMYGPTQNGPFKPAIMNLHKS